MKSSARAVLIVAPAEDIHADAVESLLKYRNLGVLRVDSADFPERIRLNLVPGASHQSYLIPLDGKKVFLSEIVGLWWRRPNPHVIDAAVSGTAHREFARLNAIHAFEGTMSTLRCRMVNKIWAQRRADRKAVQLEVALACGLRVPRTVMTNDPDAVRKIATANGSYIYKSFEKVRGAVDGTRPLEPEDFSRLDQLRHAPAIFQEFIEDSYDLRVTFVAGRFFPARILSDAPQTKYDIRLDFLARIEPWTLPDELTASLCELMKRLDLVYGAIDMKVSRNGEYTFLEVNPAGQWIFVEVQTGQPITETLVAYLAGDPIVTKQGA
jgi:glutathione synthase/RimK-type ligase-like ATP-grasp enzyme